MAMLPDSESELGGDKTSISRDSTVQGDEDPRREVLRSADKRNPGEQGYTPQKPATAALWVAPSHRDRGRLVVYAQRSRATGAVRAPKPAVRPTLVRPSMALKGSRFALV